jgi:hypothetical protein
MYRSMAVFLLSGPMPGSLICQPKHLPMGGGRQPPIAHLVQAPFHRDMTRLPT